jgi:hypothetical protein
MGILHKAFGSGLGGSSRSSGDLLAAAESSGVQQGDARGN